MLSPRIQFPRLHLSSECIRRLTTEITLSFFHYRGTALKRRCDSREEVFRMQTFASMSYSPPTCNRREDLAARSSSQKARAAVRPEVAQAVRVVAELPLALMPATTTTCTREEKDLTQSRLYSTPRADEENETQETFGRAVEMKYVCFPRLKFLAQFRLRSVFCSLPRSDFGSSYKSDRGRMINSNHTAIK